MSGAIVVEGIDRYYPQLRHMRERVIILRDRDIEHVNGAIRKDLIQRLEIPSARCGTSTDQETERVFTANGQIRPKIPITPGERQFWRIVNASPDRYADLEVSGQKLEIVALDGMPLSYHDPHRQTEKLNHVLVPPAGRVEAIVVGPPANVKATLSTRCIDTGTDGDANPAMVIADVGSAKSSSPEHPVPAAREAAIYKKAPGQEMRK
jgi:hypothetical protein